MKTGGPDGIFRYPSGQVCQSVAPVPGRQTVEISPYGVVGRNIGREYQPRKVAVPTADAFTVRFTAERIEVARRKRTENAFLYTVAVTGHFGDIGQYVITQEIAGSHEPFQTDFHIHKTLCLRVGFMNSFLLVGHLLCHSLLFGHGCFDRTVVSGCRFPFADPAGKCPSDRLFPYFRFCCLFHIRPFFW